jgi:hypothetical protein
MTASIAAVAPPATDVDSSPINTDALNTDGRKPYEWKSKWEKEARQHIRYEAIFLGAIFFITLALIFLTWSGLLFNLLSDPSCCSKDTFTRYAYFYLGGQLGGILFGIKYMYKVVSRGFWHEDRRLWRIFSPLLAGGLAVMVGALIDSGMIGLAIKHRSGSSYLAFGFITGYFADSALAKMQEIANTIFGAPGSRDKKSD